MKGRLGSHDSNVDVKGKGDRLKRKLCTVHKYYIKVEVKGSVRG